MKYRADVTVEIDLVEAFTDLRRIEQEHFIKEFLPLLDDEELVKELERRGYTIYN